MSGAQVLIHPKFLQRAPLCDVVRYFERLGRALCNTRARNLEARPTPQTPICDSYFAFARRPQ